jgi:hypothetical protein
METPRSSTRLYAILARRAPVGVIFRRGPSKQVLLIRWNLEDDTFETGQWLKGRIYERRCDLSPGGDVLIYFAANWRPPYKSWTAVSRPPFLTALALWPKGDAWGGGGHFISRTVIALNHPPCQMGRTAASSLAPSTKIQPFGKCSGGGEDNPIWHARLMRDGWAMVCEGRLLRRRLRSKVGFEFDPPIVYRKPQPAQRGRCLLQMSISGIAEKDGAWYVTEHSLIRDDQVEVIGRSDWADWSRSGDLLFAKGGQLFRLRCEDGALPPLASSVELADFSNLTFEPRESPPEARVWPG